TVSINQHDSEQLSISVKDTGTGIKKSDISRLFQPFQQISANLTHNYKGTGLGLYLSDKLAVVIGADIKVTSKYGEGSEFILTLPLVINKPIEPENFLEKIDVIIKE
ncbi:MAG: ATP-binding protein, partial [Proteobacteria bacterium]|nr:ATP-binding protein [Pseudomonadota bacterium]